MKLFVTVGTTRFPRLMKRISTDPFFQQHECVLQVGPGGGRPEGFKSFEYTGRIDSYYRRADVVITHAGAGTIYRLLELRKRMVIVPNIDRVDLHQYDIANFMHSNGYAVTVTDFSQLSEAVNFASRKSFRVFRPDPFFAGDEILNYIDAKVV